MSPTSCQTAPPRANGSHNSSSTSFRQNYVLKPNQKRNMALVLKDSIDSLSKKLSCRKSGLIFDLHFYSKL
ncbi:hypothetical protein NMYAN_180005 [Nitrosomonas nitrosa]|uniref:Uncharacterized protein n=1 Tax=Nitrosomonas nitrosa TaxID=52442 RepID=A0A8H8YYB0_9PROT|nr:hypothetical protein NMYAN_180005 [Nitrosomonas nitrosa]